MKAAALDKKLGDVVAVQSGFAFKSSEYSDSGHFLIRIANVQDGYLSLEKPKYVALDAKTKRFELRAGDILTSLTGNVGRVAKVEPEHLPAALNQRVARLVPKPDAKIDAQYLLRFLHSSTFSGFLEERAHGAAQANVSPSVISEVPIPLPPLDEQQRIVAVLDDAFEGLARARAHAEANLKNARELFENYRENFLDPSKRQGWSLRKLDDLISIKHGFAFKSAFFVDQGQYAVLTPGNYHETGGFRDRGKKQRYYSSEFPREFLLMKRDLLMAMTEQAPGLLGSCMIVPEDDGYLHNQRLGLISPKDGVAWSPEYFAQAFNLKAFRKGLSDTCSGATVRHTSPGRILAESIPYSDASDELEAVALDLTERERDCRNLERSYRDKLQDIEDLSQSLLQKAFAGELT